MSTTPPPPPPPPLGQQFSQPAAKRKPQVSVDVVAKGRALVTGPGGRWAGLGSRVGREWLVEDEHGNHIGKATSSHNVGHLLAKHYGHEPDSYEIEHEVEPGAYSKWENQQAGR